MKGVIICLFLIGATPLVFGGYELGRWKTQKETSSKFLNEWFWEYEGRPQVYREGFVYLPKTERDSLYQDALERL